MIEPIVIRPVRFGMVRRRQHRHLVPIDRIAAEKVLHLVRHLGRRVAIAPRAHQPSEHPERAAQLLLAQPPEFAQLRIRHAHVLLVRLADAAVVAQRLQLGGGRLRQQRRHRRHAELALRIQQKAAQIGFRDAADRIHIGRRAIVLGHVAAQRFVHVGRAEHQQAARPAAHPQHQLRQQVRHHHARPRLDVLQRQVLAGAAAVRPEARHQPAGNGGEHRQQGAHRTVDVHLQMMAAQLAGQLCGQLTRLAAGIAAAHVACDQQTFAQLGGGGRCVFGIAENAAHVLQHLRRAESGERERLRIDRPINEPSYRSLITYGLHL